MALDAISVNQPPVEFDGRHFEKKTDDTTNQQTTEGCVNKIFPGVRNDFT